MYCMYKSICGEEMNRKYVDENSKYLKLKEETATLFGSKCVGCDKEYEPSFAFHHMNYFDDEKIYSDFDNTADYNLYVLPIVKRNPQRFRLVCCDCHQIISIDGKINFSKLRQCYTLSKKIPPEWIEVYCKIWTDHKYDLKQYFKIIFSGKNNQLSKKCLEEINNGSLNKWKSKDEFFW